MFLPANRAYMLFVLLLLLALVANPAIAESGNENQTFTSGVSLLLQKDFKKKAQGIQKIAASSDERTEALFNALLAGKLFRIKRQDTLVYADIDDGMASLTDALTGTGLGTMKKRKIKKITINNTLRTQLKEILARLDLGSPNPEIRLAAVNKLTSSLSAETAELLAEFAKKETNPDVKKALVTAGAIAVLRGTNTEEKLEALDQLKGSLNPSVRNELTSLLAATDDPELKKETKAVLASIEGKIHLFGILEKIFFGLSLGSVLVLTAIGLAITFGVIGVINMAHGELIMLGAYTTYVLQQLLPNAIGTALVLSIPAAFVVSGLVGIIIERTVIRFLYGRPLETLLATFGISLILQQAVRTIFSPLNRSVTSPAWMSGSLQLNPILSLTTNRLIIFIFTLLVFTGLYLIMRKSSIGLKVRAVSQNRSMARAMGIRAARVDAITFGLGSGIAGIAGVALSQLTNVGPNLGQAYIIDSFMVVVFGGVGNLWGALIGGLSLGVTNKFLEPWAGAVPAKIMILVFIILFIQKRPQGLFPQKGRAAG